MAVQAIARLKYVSIPPRKMRLVASLIKGKPVERALNILNFTPRIAARHLVKTLTSAVANALSSEGTDHLHAEDLFVKSIVVNEAPTQKRIRFQSMGRVFRYRKRFSHLTVIVAEQPPKAAPAAPVRTEAKADKAKAKTTRKAPAKKKTAAKKTVVKKKTTAKKTAKKSASVAKTRTKSKTTAKTGGQGKTTKAKG